MIDIRHFITLENSVAATLRPDWGVIAHKLLAELHPLIAAGKWADAHVAANQLDLRGLVKQNEAHLEELATSAILFGAHHVTGDPATTSFIKDRAPLPAGLKGALHQLTVMIEQQGADYIRDRLNAFIEAEKHAATDVHWQVTKDEITVGDLAASGGLQMPEQGPGKKPLYVYRPLLNAEQVIAWAKPQGFKTTLPADDMHVTICFSKTPLDWHAVPDHFDTLRAGHSAGRDVKRLGDALVLTFKQGELSKRWQEFRDAGASWAYPSYQPHITISYDDEIDADALTPYTGPLEFGPEVFEPIDAKWTDDIVETVVKAEMNLADRLNEAVLGDGQALIDMGANLTTSRLVSLGFLAEAGTTGVGSYQVNELLDAKTCRVCQYMHGKTFPIQSEQDRLMQSLSAQDPHDAASTMPWPGQSKDDLADLYSMSNEELQAAGYGSPPYHPGCRGILVMTGSVADQQPVGSMAPDTSLNRLMDGLMGGAELDPTVAELTGAASEADLVAAEFAAQGDGLDPGIDTPDLSADGSWLDTVAPELSTDVPPVTSIADSLAEQFAAEDPVAASFKKPKPKN